jgi:hypothetical protein
MSRSIKRNVYLRIATNKRKAAEAQERDQKEREVIRVLVQQVQPDKDDIVGQCAATMDSVFRRKQAQAI